MKKVVYGLLAFAPVLTFAQNANTQGLTDIVTFIANTVRSLIPIMFGLAIVYFFWGLIQYIRNPAGGKEGEKGGGGRAIMIAGLVSLFIMVSVWGIINLAQNALGVNTGGTFQVPYVPVR